MIPSTDHANDSPNVSMWNDAVERKLADLCDQAKAYAWMHDRSYRTMRRRSFIFVIPVIIINILTSSATFGLAQYVSENDQKWLNVGVGSLNILAAILAAVDKLYGYSERVGMHKAAMNAWTKLGTSLECELALPREQRTPSEIFWKTCRNEFDRLLEIAPIVPHHIITAFRRMFGQRLHFSVPVVVGALQHTFVYANNVSPIIETIQLPSITTDQAQHPDQPDPLTDPSTLSSSFPPPPPPPPPLSAIDLVVRDMELQRIAQQHE